MHKSFSHGPTQPKTLKPTILTIKTTPGTNTKIPDTNPGVHTISTTLTLPSSNCFYQMISMCHYFKNH